MSNDTPNDTPNEASAPDGTPVEPVHVMVDLETLGNRPDAAIAAIGPTDTYAAEFLDTGAGAWFHTGHWRDGKGALQADDYLAARAILAVRPGLTDAEIQADAEAQIAAGNDPSTVREDAYSLTYYLTYWTRG